MKTFAETTIIGRLTSDAINLKKEGEQPLFKTQLASTIEGLAEGAQSTFWYTLLVSSEKLAQALKKGTVVKVNGQLVPNIYEGKVSYTFRKTQITLLERPAE
ncbi:MAG: hypothetical protein AAFY71_24500 [Bacteroidota bacterium]